MDFKTTNRSDAMTLRVRTRGGGIASRGYQNIDMAPEAAKNPRQLFIDLTDSNFKNVVIDSKEAFIIEIRADWSGECFIMEPILRQLATEFWRTINFGYVNVDTNEEITKRYGVTELPFIMYFNNGELIHHSIGLQSKKIVRHYIKETITSSSI